jgi:hypothetical protein
MNNCDRRLIFGVLVVAGSFSLGGCIVYKAAKTTGELAATTVIVAGKTAGAVVKTTGKVAVSAITSTGSLTATGIESLAALAQAGMVTFVDVTTGVIVRVPWQEGMNLYTGGTQAEVVVARRVVDLVRRGKVVYQATRQADAGPKLESGDVVRLAGRVAN